MTGRLAIFCPTSNCKENLRKFRSEMFVVLKLQLRSGAQ